MVCSDMEAVGLYLEFTSAMVIHSVSSGGNRSRWGIDILYHYRDSYNGSPKIQLLNF